MTQEILNLSLPTSDSTPPDRLPERLCDEGFLSLDVEHQGLGREARAVGVSVADELEGDWYFPFGHAEGLQHDPEKVRAWLKEHLAGREVVFRAAKNDIEVLRRWGLDLEALNVQAHEVQHCAALLDDSRRKFDLETLCQDRLGVGKVKLPFDASFIWQRPPSHSAEYARQDARLTLELWQSYLPDIEKQDLGRVLQLEDKLIYCTMSMERNGCPLDIEKLERWDGEIKAAYLTRVLEIYRQTQLRINPNSDDMVKLFRHLGIKHSGYTTSEGKESFTDDVLESWAGTWEGVGKDRRFKVHSPLIQLAREARQLDSLRSKYTLKYLKGNINGVLYYQLHQLRADEGGTITGRYASSGIEVQNVRMGGNIQQVKKPDKQEPVTLDWIIRDLFIPPRGRLFFDADASQIEFRLLAHYSKSEKLIKAYRDNPDQDFHQLVTDDILGGIMSRTLAKNFNFMKVYGGGVGKVMLMTGLDEVEATQMDREYNRKFPEAGETLNHATSVAEQRGWVKTYLGRRRRYRKGDRFYSALNSVLQGTAADLMKLALLVLYNRRRELDLVLRATQHDEAIGDVGSEEKALKIHELLNEQRLPLRVPITWETGIGESWYKAKPTTQMKLIRGDKVAREKEGFKNP